MVSRMDALWIHRKEERKEEREKLFLKRTKTN